MHKIIYNINKSLLAVIFISIFSTILGCRDSVEPTIGNLYAHAGDDQTTLVGSYAMLDGSKSEFTEFNGISWFEWEQDPSNPDSMHYMPSGSGENDLIFPMVFSKEGIYKFYLTITEEEERSNKSKVVITVYPRLKSQFEDINLEAQVRYRLKEPLNPITDSDLLTLDSLFNYALVTNSIKSLEGIQYCTNLKYLSMSLEDIENITPLANLTNLEWLDLDQNWKISDINPLKNLTKLKHLNLDGNLISDIIPLVNLSNLNYLNIMYNEDIIDISPIENILLLEELWISNSPIKNIEPIKKLTKLKNLWLAKCEISDITVISELTELRSLFLKINYVSDISSLAKLTKMERLYLSNNNVSDISVLENMLNISWFILPDNQIEDIVPLVNNTGLGKGDLLDLSRNPLNERSINEHLSTLRDRGVIVFFD